MAAPLIRLFLGQITPQAALAAAADANANTKKGQTCEANFYSGEFALQQGAKDQATRLFRLAASGCPTGFIEFAAATAELKALGSGRETPHDRAVALKNRGDAYADKGDLDRAIADYNEAIRLDPKYAVALKNRGNMYDDKGDLDRAIADYNEAIRLDPQYAVAFNDRGNVYAAKGDLDRAIADYNEAIRLDPKLVLPFWNRGIANLYAGSLAKALADMSQVSKLDPKDAYAALWLDIVNRRSNLPSRLPQQVAQIDMSKWPAPLIRLFLGQMTPRAALAAAADANANTKKGQTCEANFYSGELALQQGAKDQATRLFRLAASGCQKGFIEFTAASAELKALGAN